MKKQTIRNIGIGAVACSVLAIGAAFAVNSGLGQSQPEAPPAVQMAASGQAAKPAASNLAGSTMIMNCKTGEPSSSPTKLMVNCGPRMVQLDNIKWSNYGSETATATATAGYWDQSEQPDVGWPVKLTVSGLDKLEATQRYATMIVTHTGDTPSHIQRTATYSLRKAEANTPAQTAPTNTPKRTTAPKPANQGSAQAPAKVNAGAYTFMQDCKTSEVKQSPAGIFVNCGNRTVQFNSLKWSDWGQPTAKAVGRVAFWDQSEGPDVDFAVTVTVNNLQAQEANQRYGSLTYTITSKHPAEIPTTQTVKLG